MDKLLFPAAVFAVGLLSGFVNIMAGGGSVLTLGIMMLLGLGGPMANGTNRIGVLFGNLSGVAAYKSEHFGNFRDSIIFGLCALPGAVIGAAFAIRISTALFQQLLAIVMVFVIVTLFLPPRKSKAHAEGFGRWLIYPLMFFIGLYGGFIQAGVGFLIMASLRHCLRLDLITINMHKNWIVLFYTLPILCLFGITGNIHWLYAIVLASGNALGAWLSVKVSIKKGENVIKIVLCAAIVLLAVKFFFRI